LLRECHARTGLGGLHVASNPGNDGHNRKPQVRWWLWTRADALRLVDLLREFPLRSKKARDLMIWSEAVQLWQTVTAHRGGNMHNGRFMPTSNDGVWDRMEELHEQLILVRRWKPHDSLLVPEPFEDHAVAARNDQTLF
jgi:hypothetical protein